MRPNALLLVVAVAAPAFGHAQYRPQGKPFQYDGYFATFPSGMRLVAYEMPHVDRVSVTVSYGVGGVQDPPGKEGLAHLLEHLAFRAAPTALGGARIWDRLRNAGFEFNAFTNFDTTDYYEVGRPGELRAAAVHRGAADARPPGGRDRGRLRGRTGRGPLRAPRALRDESPASAGPMGARGGLSRPPVRKEDRRGPGLDPVDRLRGRSLLREGALRPRQCRARGCLAAERA